MSIHELKGSLRDIPGIEALTMESSLGRQHYSFNGHFVSLDAAASMDQVQAAIRKAVHEAKPADVYPLDPAPPRPDGAPAPLQTVSIKTAAGVKLTISGIQPGSIKEKIETMQRHRVKRRETSFALLDAAHKKHDRVDDMIEQAAGRMDKEAEASMHEFAQFTNGAEFLEDLLSDDDKRIAAAKADARAKADALMGIKPEETDTQLIAPPIPNEANR